MPLETESTQAPVSDGERDELHSRAPESWMGPVRAGVRARLFDAVDEASTAKPLKIGRYIVIKRIGEGGMGMVYAAYDDQLDRKVAVKLLRPGHQRVTPHAQARLTREAQAIARLSHPSIVKVYEVGIHNAEVFVAMEYVEGTTLKEWQAKRGWKDILGRYVAAGRGLEAAHEAGIVHRDFKADNVLVRRAAPHRADGVRVLDFGLASTDPQDAALPENQSQPPPEAKVARAASLTHTGAVMGTPAYMAPEQHVAMATDGRTDQFSFCVSLFEALHGFRPFAGETLEELRANVLAGAIEDDPRYREIPAALSAALRRGMQVDPRERFPSMTALLAELEVDERPRWKRAAIGLGIAAAAAVGVLQVGTSDAGDLVAEAARVRAEFERSRSANAAEDLRALRARTAPQQWDDLVLTVAQTRLPSDPTTVLAALKHLRPASRAWLDSARSLAADAARRGPLYDALELDYPIERLIAPGAPAAQHLHRFAGISANGALLRIDFGAAGLRTSTVDLGDGSAQDVALTSTGAMLVVTEAGLLQSFGPDGAPELPPRQVGDVVRLAVDSTDTRLALGRGDGTIVVSDLDGTAHRELRGPQTAITHLTFHPRRATLASATGEAEVWMWFLDRETHRTLEMQSPIEHLEFDDGALVATTRDGGIRRDDRTGAHRNPSWSDGTHDARAAPASQVSLEATADALHAHWGPGSFVALDRSDRSRDFQLSGDGEWALASFASQLRLWDLRTDDNGTRRTGERSIRLPADEEVVGLVTAADGLIAFSARGSVFRIRADAAPATSADPLSAATLEATLETTLTATLEAARPRTLRRTLVGPHGRSVALVDSAGALHVVDLAHLDGVRSLGQQRPLAEGTVAWSPTGAALVKCGCPRDGQACTMTLHNVDGSAPARLGAVPDPASMLRVSADGSRMLSEHPDRTVVWSLDEPGNREQLAVPSAESGVERSQVAFAFTPAGRVRIATADRAKSEPRLATLRVWESFGSDNTLLELFVEADLRALISTAEHDGVVLATTEQRTLLWMLDEGTFRSLPEGLFHDNDAALRGDGVQIHVGPDRAHLWIASGAEDTVLIDLETGRRRSLPTLVPPVAWTPDGALADVVRFREIRHWSSPAPATPEAFLRWIDAQTRISIPAQALLSAD